MKKDLWGPRIWIFIHCFTLRIKDEYFMEEKKNIIDYITRICDNLPCPECSLHATQYLKKHNFKHIKTKDHLIQIIFNLHNDVNKRTNKPLFNIDKVNETYNKYNFQKIIIAYINLNQKINYAEKMMLYTLRRREFLKQILDYFKSNIDKYNIIDPELIQTQ